MRILYLGNSHHVVSVLRQVRRWPPIEKHAVHLAEDRMRSPILDIREAVWRYPYLEDTWQFTRQADGAIYVATPERHLYRWPEKHLERLRHDLIAAGRDPERFPVVFDVVRLDYDDPLATEEELVRVLRWPWSDRFDTATGPMVPEDERRHHLPVARLLEMIDQGPP